MGRPISQARLPTVLHLPVEHSHPPKDLALLTDLLDTSQGLHRGA